MPPFFIQGQGPTVLRQYVVEWSIVLLSFASLVIMARFRRERAPFLYWYSLALALVAIAMLAFFLQTAVGSLIGWLGRSAYVLAGIYFLISVSTALREARTRGVGLSEAIAALLGPGLYWQEILATVSDAVVSYDEKGRILLWNKAAERIFGYPEAEVMGQGLEMILPEAEALNAASLSGGIAEIELQRQDGSRFSAEVSLSTKSSSLGVIVTLIIRDVSARKRAEAALRQAKEKWEGTFDAVPDLIALLDERYRIIRVNRAMAEALKTSPEDLVGRLCYEVMHNTSGPPGFCPHSQLLADGRRHSAELHELGLDLLVTTSPLSDDQGNLIGSVHVARDITAAKGAEAALRESEEHYRSLFDHMLEGFAYCKMHFEQDRPVDFTYLKVNGAFETLTGLKNVTGKKVSEVIPGIREADPQLFEIFGRVALTGIPERFEDYVEALQMWFSISVFSPRQEYFVAVFDVITERKRAEEQVKRMASFPQMNPNPVLEIDATGAITFYNQAAVKALEKISPAAELIDLLPKDVGEIATAARQKKEQVFYREVRIKDTVFGQTISFAEAFDVLRIYGMDITARHQAEEALRDSEERFRTMANAIPQLAWIAESDGYIFWYNQRWYDYTGTTPEEMEGWGWQSVHDPKVLPEVLEQWKTSLATGMPFDMVFPLRGADGQFRQFLTRVMPLKDSSGKVIQWFGTNTDITKRLQMEEKLHRTLADLERSNRDLEDFAFIASHDLQEPLRKIANFSEMLAKEYQEQLDDQAQRYFGYVADGAKRMQGLINALLSYSRVGRADLRLIPVSLEDVLKGTLGDLQELIRESRAEISFDPLPTLKANPHQIGQLLQNLIINAIKFCGDQPPRMHLSARQEGNEWLISLRDNGMGFDHRMSSRFLRYLNVCIPRKPTPAPASAWPFARRLSKGMAAASGPNRNRAGVPPSLSAFQPNWRVL